VSKPLHLGARDSIWTAPRSRATSNSETRPRATPTVASSPELGWLGCRARHWHRECATPLLLFVRLRCLGEVIFSSSLSFSVFCLELKKKKKKKMCTVLFSTRVFALRKCWEFFGFWKLYGYD
jgi:hypothetical protein